MTQEDKELLLKDLCARLPYGVVVKCHFADGGVLDTDDIADLLYNEENSESPMYKPYLRQMSSMTEEEQKELRILQESFDFNCYAAGDYSFQLNLAVTIWYLEHHFDFMGLISKGLAIEVTEDNNPY